MTIIKNLTLKKASIEKSFLTGRPEYSLAIEAGITPDRYSKFITGMLKPRKEEREGIARVLNRPVSELFPESGASHV